MRPVLEQLTGVRTRLAHLAFQAPTQLQQSAWRQQLDALRERKEGLESELAQRSAAFRQQRRRPGPAELAALPGATAFVDLLVYTHYEPSAEGEGPFRCEPRLLAFVSRPGRSVALVPLGAAGPVNEAVDAWRTALNAGQAGALQASAAELRRRVWEPLRPHLAGARTVLIAPDGKLMRFPFGALPGERPGPYLIEELALGYVASGRQLAEALSQPSDLAGRGLLAAGAIDYRADPGRPAPSERPAASMLALKRGTVFDPLPGTGPEARQARDVFIKTFADQPTALLLEAEPTEAELKRRLDGGRWRVVHLATHGFFESPARVAALRAAARHELPSALAHQPGMADESLAAFALTPFLHSGIVLAGGSRDPDAVQFDSISTSPAREDGILTAEEVQALDLRGTELVVLSACETGLGEVAYGQGVLGLQRAFHAAGARAVVASLWKVDDAATGALMEQFYRNLWEEQLPKLEALRQAQLAVLNDPGLVARHRAELARRGLRSAEKLPECGRVVPPADAGARSDPALWAAFVLSGYDGRVVGSALAQVPIAPGEEYLIESALRPGMVLDVKGARTDDSTPVQLAGSGDKLSGSSGK